MNKRIMVIDDEASIRQSLEEALTDADYTVRTSASLKEAETVIVEFRPHVILLDMRLKDGNGLDFIQKIKAFDEEIKTIIITAYGDIQSAVSAVKAGAMEYITKPFDLDEIEVQVERALNHYQLNRNVQLYQNEKKMSHTQIITKNDGMRKILDSARRIASLEDVTVLITGETGTGKELMADFIHKNSSAAGVPMVKINCATIPKDLFESELFGHEKNAFTGAGKVKKGLLEMADGGIVFLDEVGEIPMEQQAKLLRFLEDKQVMRVGGTSPFEVNVRVIAATNRNLWEMVQKGLFRADFFYRLNVVPITLLPLRDRAEDILVLADHFASEFNKKFNGTVQGFTQAARTYMLEYRWPGNVRELRNLIERLCIIHTGEWIDLKDLPSYAFIDQASVGRHDYLAQLDRGQCVDLPALIQEIEYECIQRAMEICQGNQSKVAEILNMSRFAVKRRIDK